jgi:hypothetical protein
VNYLKLPRVATLVVFLIWLDIGYCQADEPEALQELTRAKQLADASSSPDLSTRAKIAETVDRCIHQYSGLTASDKKRFLERLNHPLLATRSARDLLRQIAGTSNMQDQELVVSAAVATLKAQLWLLTPEEWNDSDSLPLPGLETMISLAGTMPQQPRLVSDWLFQKAENKTLPVNTRRASLVSLRVTHQSGAVQRLCDIVSNSMMSDDGLSADAAQTVAALPLPSEDVEDVFRCAAVAFRAKPKLNVNAGGFVKKPLGSDVYLPTEPAWLILVSHLGTQPFNRLAALEGFSPVKTQLCS